MELSAVHSTADLVKVSVSIQLQRLVDAVFTSVVTPTLLSGFGMK